jgi:hypothetical protein
VAVAAGFGVERARRAGSAATLAYCALALVLVGSIQLTADYQRDNWRGIARAVGPVPDQRAVLISQRGRRQPRPPAPQAVRPSFFTPFEFYRREVAKGGRIIPYPETGALIREIVVVDLRVSPRPFVGDGPPGFRAVESRKGHGYSLVRLRSQGPRIVPAGLVPRAPGSRADDKPPLVFLETPSARQRADRAQ